jgi:hypothetical protein
VICNDKIIRRNILLALPGGIPIADISVSGYIPLSINALPAVATTAGAAAARRDQQKRATYVRVDPNGFPFVPFSVDSYGRSGQPAMKLLHALGQLGDEAAGPGGINWASFVAGALRELSIRPCRGKFLCTVHVWECLQSPLGRGSGLACVCPHISMGCCRVLACGALLACACHVHVIF